MPDPRRLAATVTAVDRVGTGPCAVREVLAAGVTPAQLRAAVAAGVVLSLRKGIVVPAHAWSVAPPDRRRVWALKAAVTCYPTAFGSHGTAAVIQGLPDFASDTSGDPPRTHITRLGASRVDGWIRVHGCDTPSSVVEVVDGCPVTSLTRTSIDMAATGSLRRALVFMDAAMRVRVARTYGPDEVRARVIDPGVVRALQAEWDAAVAPYSRHRWVTKVREAIRLADPAAESVLESLSRLGMHEAGLPRPRIGAPVLGDDGRTYWVDALWDEFRLIGEADGLAKYDSVDRLVAEKRRQEALEGAGWRLVRWGMAEVHPSPAPMVARIRAAMSLASPSTRLQLL